MNKKFYMFLAVILVWASPGGSRDLTVLDYYVMIPARLLSINPEYPSKFTIRQKQGRYTADSSADYEIYPVVDIKNGYMNVTDDGTGGGSLIHEMAIFTDSGKKRYIAVNVTEHDGIGVNSRLRIYDYSGNEWKDITSMVLPVITWRDFFSAGQGKALKAPLTEKHMEELQISYFLPRYGTVIRAEISDTALRTKVFHSGETSDELKLAVEGLIREMPCSAITLEWSMSPGRFGNMKRISSKK